MATQTPLMGLEILKVGQGGDSETALWNKLITNFSTLDDHTHTAGDGARITTGALNIDADLSLNNFKLSNVSGTMFTNLTADLSDTATLYVKNNELVYRDGADNIVPITSGGGIAGTPGTISSLVAPASISFNSSLGEYSFFKNTDVYGELISADVTMYELNGATGFAVSLGAPTLTETYKITLPTASPAGNNYMMQFSSAGVASFVPGLESAGITDNQVVYATDDHTVDGLTISNNQLLLGTDSTPVSGQLTNAYVSASAAIDGTKISPNFGSQAVSTTGTLSSGALSATSVTSSGTLSVTNTATFNGSVNITDSNDTFTSAAPATFNSTVNVVGVATLANASVTTLIASGTATFNGPAIFNGNSVQLGNSSTDLIIPVGRLDGSLIPNSDFFYDLGSSSRAWSQVYAGEVNVATLDDNFPNSPNNWIQSRSNINPITNQGASLGQSGLEWDEVRATSGFFSGPISVGTGNNGGAPFSVINFTDDGDMADLQDGFLSLRFSQGVRIYSANGGGSTAIQLSNTGSIATGGGAIKWETFEATIPASGTTSNITAPGAIISMSGSWYPTSGFGANEPLNLGDSNGFGTVRTTTSGTGNSAIFRLTNTLSSEVRYRVVVFYT